MKESKPDNFENLLERYGVIPRGILHVGANDCEEIDTYLKHVSLDKIIYIEANSKIVEEVKAQSKIRIYNEVISDKDGEEVNFYITNNNSQSSSILELGIHKDLHPEVRCTETQKRITKTIQTFLKENDLKEEMFNVLVLDIQGAELLALKGSGNLLNHIECIYTEINTKEVYKKCAKMNELDNFLSDFNIERAERMFFSSCPYGNAFYVKKTHDPTQRK
jgi:FkbM family methyltransferase